MDIALKRPFILRLAQAGGVTVEEADAIARRILTVYGEGILRLAYSYVHNYADAEEILQETVFTLIRKNPELKSAEHEKAWLLRVAINLSKNRLKYNGYREADALESQLIADEREDLSFVWDAVKGLEVKYREVIHLYYYEGYSTAEVAKLVGRRESTVRSELFRARKKLKEILKEAYDFE